MILFLLFVLSSCRSTNPSSILNEPIVLEHLVRESKGEGKAPTLILMHGYGSNEKDLFSLSKHIPENWLVISLRAPTEMGPNKYKWYDITFTDGDLINKESQAEESRKLVMKFIQQAQQKYAIDPDRIVVGGFSQGAVMSFSIGLITPDKVKGIACFSGYVLDDVPAKATNKSALKDLKAFISHGSQDPVVQFNKANIAKQILEDANMNVTTSFDDQKHTISNQHFSDFIRWIKTL